MILKSPEYLNTDIYIDNLHRIIDDQEYNIYQKNRAVFSIFHILIEDMSAHLDIHFTTLFARCAFVASYYNLNGRSKYYLHLYRRILEKTDNSDKDDTVLALGEQIIISLARIKQGEVTSISLPTHLAKAFPSFSNESFKFVNTIRGIIVGLNIDEAYFNFISADDGTQEIKVFYDIADSNDIFSDTIKSLTDVYSFPIDVNLIDVTVIDNGSYIPKAFVLDPDYLVDVTSIAESFKNYGTDSKLSLLRKLKSVDTSSIPLVLGNAANMIFDQLLSNPKISFEELLPQIFKINPLGIAAYTNGQVLNLVKQAEAHFHHLKKVIVTTFPAIGIDRKYIYLEPTFYSMLYGLQGRLDLFHYNPKKEKYDIVELKSGSPFRPNAYGLSINHYVQTLLYDLLVKSAYGHKIKPNNYILYSKIPNGLKYAPSLKIQQYEAMNIRNELVLLDRKLSSGALAVHRLVESLNPDLNLEVKGYQKKDLEELSTVFGQLQPYEKEYIYEFISFIYREMRLSKVGEHGLYNNHGLAGLWRKVDDEKEDNFSLLKHMTILINNSQDKIPTITLEKTNATSELANFRVGDIVVLFPTSGNSYDVLNNQIFKCTIIYINNEIIKVKLRSPQFNTTIFNKYNLWNIEQDVLDSGFNASTRSLYDFSKLDIDRKKLLLGLKEPMHNDIKVPTVDNLTQEQNQLIQEAVSAEDFYLLWGPPGTGKTSVMIRRLIDYLYRTTDEKILLLAYTNRAVDEICEALNRAIDDRNYIRIGSTYGCNVKYRGQLLDEKIEIAKSRNDILNVLLPTRIYVGTLSSVLGKSELFQLVDFDRVIIDEASQILEPLILGILSRVKKFILIGDHRQLPAVVQQPTQQRKIKSKFLRSKGITDMGMSFFERLYNQCLENGWTSSLGILTHQGRMHKELTEFPNENFYDGKLKLIAGINRLNREIKVNDKSVCAHRLNYINTEVEDHLEWKTNSSEARAIVLLIKDIVEELPSIGMEFHDNSIGVIAPYRAQIALIKSEMSTHLSESLYTQITVDTVERYQGGARDIIILSLCTNNSRQFEKLISLSSDGVDRKLNVAITRSKEFLYIVGNERVIRSNPLYAALIDRAHLLK